MTRPGVQFADIASAPRRFAPTATDTGFMIGFAERGPATTWTLSQSLDEWKANHGARLTYSQLADQAECFFAEGGAKLYTARVVGASPVSAFVDLMGASAVTARVAAKYPGPIYNNITIDVIVVSSTFQIVVKDTSGAISGTPATILETSPFFATVTDAVAWSVGSSYVTVIDNVLGADNPVAVTNVPLTGGTDDNANATQTQYDTALDLFPGSLGPGQVAAPGVSTTAMNTSLSNHAAAKNRFAIFDLPNSTSKATLVTAASAIRSLVNARKGMIVGGYQTIPALVAGAPRTVSRVGTVMGLIARQDIATGNPNLAAAGDQGSSAGDSVFATGLVYTPTAADRAELNLAGVNVAINYYGAIRNYGFVTAADRTLAPNHWQASNVRLDMAIKADALAIGDTYVFRQIDGRGHTAAAFAGELSGMLNRYYQLGALYDDSFSGGAGGPTTAFRVDTGSGVNTPALVASGTLSAAIQVRRSPFAELVQINVRVVSTQEALS
ncbi:MAG: hypothetical protein JWM31_1259 [Solirubrobacterales bacterium]|nr:hypothetical protein [Solirubrobacterales bacterium]